MTHVNFRRLLSPRRLPGALATALAWAAALQAQTPLQLSLGQAVDIALAPDGSTRVALAQEAIAQAETHILQAKSALLPTVDTGLQVRNQTVNLRTFGFDINVPGFSLPSVVGPFTVIDARANAKQAILDFPSIKRYHAIKASADATRADLNVTRDQVADQTARAYLAVLRADAALQAAQSNLRLSEALVDQAQNLKDAGTGTGIEITRAKVQVANDRQQLIVAEDQRQRAALQLLRVMGLDQSRPVAATTMLRFDPVDVDELDAALNLARMSRSELKAQTEHQRVAQMNVDAVSAEKLPSVNGFGDYGGIGRASIGLQRTYTVGVQITLPVFDGGRRKARLAESEAQLRQEQIRTRDLDQQVELEVRLAIQSVRAAQAQVTTAREGLDLAQSELEQARRRLDAGVSIPLEVTDAQTRLAHARDNEIAALYSFNLARLELAVATGTVRDFVRQ